MGFAQSRARLQTAVFGRLGEDATWTGIPTPVRIRLAEMDAEVGFGEARLIAPAKAIRVHRDAVPAPMVGDMVQLLDSLRAFRVSQEPQVDLNGVWQCPAVEVEV